MVPIMRGAPTHFLTGSCFLPGILLRSRSRQASLSRQVSLMRLTGASPRYKYG
jgi:hypothetical protein